MALSIDDLGLIQEELIDACVNSYNIGLQLKVPVGKLDSIKVEYSKPSDQLRETLKAWLKTATHHKWQTIVDALRTRAVGEPKLASDIEAKYCQGTPGQASGPAILKVTQIEVLQQHFDQKLQEQQRAIEAMQLQLELKQQLQSTSMKQPSAQPQPNPPQQETTLRRLIWQDCPKAPETIYRGSVATDGIMVYCNDCASNKVHQYRSDTQQWSTLPNLPHIQSNLVMADRKLTSVGGYQGGATDSILSLTGEGRDRKWSQHFPPMITKRFWTAAICHGRSLIVAGGSNGPNILATVEVLNMDTRLWSIASSLPHPLSWATTLICGERLYLLGGYDQTGGTRSVLTCSISELLHSCQTLSQSTVWQRVANAPYKLSSCATLCGQLIVLGGRDEANKATTAVSAYDKSTNSWLAMEDMKTPRYRALAASLHDNTMLVIGGFGLDTVEIAKLS